MRQWELRKSQNKLRKIPFSSVFGTPKQFQGKRRASYTPSVDIKDFDFTNIDLRIKQRTAEKGRGDYDEGEPPSKLKVLRELNSYNMKKRKDIGESSVEGIGTTEQMIGDYYKAINENNEIIRVNFFK